jgi:hypothetical protein
MGPNDGSERPAGSADAKHADGVARTDTGTAVYDANPEVRNRGQIAEMTLPRGWVEALPVQFAGGVGMKSRRVIHPPEAPRVRLVFFYRGLPMSQKAGKSFFDVLQGPPHDLTEQEWDSLAVLLRDREDPSEFMRFAARTADWNGRRVLVVEGRYLEIQEDNFEIFIDAVGDGRTVQEVIYQAPTDVYNKYLRIAESSLKSIRWKQPGEDEQSSDVGEVSSGATAATPPTTQAEPITRRISVGSWPLSPEKEAQLSRDLADIEKLPLEGRSKILESLGKLAEDTGLAPEERAELAVSLLHQIACPGSIKQGYKDTCLVANIEKSLAMQHPEQYAEMVVQLATTGEYSTPDGKTTLKAQRSADGRLMGYSDAAKTRSRASELMQTAVMQLGMPEGERYESYLPGHRPLPEGVSPAEDLGERWIRKDGAVCKWQGLLRGAQETILNKLVPDDCYQSRPIRTPDDLGTAWKDNGGRPPLQVTMAIDASGSTAAQPPEAWARMHAVNITHVEPHPDGQPAKIYYENTAGGPDHSYPNGTPVPVDEFVKSVQTSAQSITRYTLGKATGYSESAELMTALVRTYNPTGR